MDVDGSADVGEFEDYLQDEIFVDYFNTFLSLPIFPRRFLYRPRRQKFDIDPPFKSFQVDKKVLLTWIATKRLPLFWKTDLFLDYLLCKLLISPPENELKTQVSQMVDEKTLRKHIGNLIGMQHFRYYTKGTKGERILNFWCEAETFRRHTKSELRRFVFREIQFKYLTNGSAYEVPDAIKWRIYGEESTGKRVKNVSRNLSIFSEDIFVSAQELVVENLFKYWVPKYILHRCREIATTFQQRRLSRAIVARNLKETVKNQPLGTLKEDTESDTDKGMFEAVEEEDEYEKEKDAFFETNRVSSTESDYRDSDKTSRNGSPFLPEIKRSSTLALASKDVKDRSRSESLKLPSLLSKSNISEASDDENSLQNEILYRKHKREFDIKEFLKLSTPFAMVKNGGASRNKKDASPKMQPKNKQGEEFDSSGEAHDDSEDDSEYLDNILATNLAQIIKPNNHEEIPKTPLSAYHTTSAIWSSEEKSMDGDSLFLPSMTADRLAGGPFKHYLKSTDNHGCLTTLQFWEDVQGYTAMTTSSAVDLKFRLGRNLIVTYLQRGSVREVTLDRRIRERLCYLLRRGQADTILSKIADEIVKVLYEPWQSFVEADKENLKNVLIMNTRRKSLCVEEAMQDGKQEKRFRMFRALDLALCIVGDSQQMDIEEDDDDASDSEEEKCEEEGSLRKRRLTVVNEEAALALAMGPVEEDTTGENARRKSHFYGKVIRKVRKCSLFNSSAFKTRPPKPKKFADILADTVQLLWLKRFLTDHDAIMPLKFWQDVERMKTQSKDSRARQTKARVIVKQYFANTDDPSKNLQCRADIIREIPRMEHVTPAMLVSAQACVIRSLEEQWFSRYLATFPEDAKEEDVEKYAARNTLMGLTKIASRGKTRGLWALFGHSMMTFIRGVTKDESCAAFTEFLINECRMPTEGRKNANQVNKRIINNRVISAEHLVNDLKFWLEVQRFKSISDGASACAMAGNYTVDDEKMIQFKARTILDCYLESTLPPKIQINVPAEIAEGISGEFAAGIVDRGMFHDAEIYVFCTLINYWKKFLAKDTRFDVVTGKEGNKAKKTKRRERVKSEKEVLYLDDVPYKKVALGPDEEPRLSFSLLTGLRLITGAE